MALSIANKALVGAVSTVALGGVTYGVYSQFSTKSDVKETIIKKSKTPLNLTAITGEDIEHWQELVKQHRGNRLAGKTKISNLNLKSDDDVQGLKDKCKELLKTEVGHADYEKNLSYAGDWCIKEKAPRKIASLLRTKNKVLLKNDNSDNWDTQWNAFKEAYKTSNPTGDWEINDWTRQRDGGVVSVAFKEKCIANGAMSIVPFIEDTFLEEIVKYCTK